LDATGTMTIQAQKKKKYRRKPGLSRNLKWILGVTISVIIAVIIYMNIPPANTISNQPVTQSITESIKPIYGQLEITSEPSGAIVFLDEQRIGETPFRHDSLGERTYQIRLKKTGYQDWYDSGHNIKAGIFHPIHVSLNKTSPKIVKNAGLQVDIFPEGIIYLNDKKTEKNVMQEIIPGEYNIKFEHPEYGIQEEKILLSEGENKKLTCYFQQWVSIQSISELGDPIWASIVINDKKTDFYTPRQIALSPGKHKIYLSKSGYELVEKPMTLDIKPTFEKIVHPVIFHLKKY